MRHFFMKRYDSTHAVFVYVFRDIKFRWHSRKNVINFQMEFLKQGRVIIYLKFTYKRSERTLILKSSVMQKINIISFQTNCILWNVFWNIGDCIPLQIRFITVFLWRSDMEISEKWTSIKIRNCKHFENSTFNRFTIANFCNERAFYLLYKNCR